MAKLTIVTVAKSCTGTVLIALSLSRIKVVKKVVCRVKAIGAFESI
jgi:hypothetical protein